MYKSICLSVLDFIKNQYACCFFYFMWSIIALSFAYIGQYVFLWKPCILCIYERIPYIIIIFISIFSLIVRKYPNSFFHLLLLFQSILSAYHTGVDFLIFDPPSVCSQYNILDTFLGAPKDFDDVLNSTELLSCEKLSVWILGFPLSGWHFIATIPVLIIGLYLDFISGKEHKNS